MKKFIFVLLVLSGIGLAGCERSSVIFADEVLFSQRFDGQFYYRGVDGFYSIWDLDGTPFAQHTTHTPLENTRIFEFIFYEDEMKGRRNWASCFFRHINVGPYVFILNNDGTELQVGITVGSGVAIWRTHTRRLEHGIVMRSEHQKIDERFNGIFHWQSEGHYRYWEFNGTARVRYTVYSPAWVSPPLIVSGEVILDSFAHSALRTTVLYEFRIYEDGTIRHRKYDHQAYALWSDDPELFAIVGPVVYGPYQFYFNKDATELRIGSVMGPGNIQWRTYIKR